MTFEILENTFSTSRHTTFWLSCGLRDAVPLIFVHGWPELSATWRHQLPVFARLGFHAVAPDMRGYGRSTIHPEPGDYAVANAALDMIELLDHLGAAKAVWVGHDWGSPVVWSIARHHPDRCHGIASLCAPYLPEGFALRSLLPHVNRELYPEARFPLGQWSYFRWHQEHLAEGAASFERSVADSVRLLFRRGDPAGRGQPSATAFTMERGGFFGRRGSPPKVERDSLLLSEADEHRYVAALSRGGFKAPNSWYVNDAANLAYAAAAPTPPTLTMPVLFLHAAYDPNCDTLDSTLAEPMRRYCARLDEVTVPSGHWMPEESPVAVNAAITRWLATRLPDIWSG